jgi:hypothetical protein
MQGKIVLVTGANGGLGSHVTQAFVDAGANVVGTSRKIQQSEFANRNFVAMAAELSTPQGANALVEQVGRALWTHRRVGTHRGRLRRRAVSGANRRRHFSNHVRPQREQHVLPVTGSAAGDERHGQRTHYRHRESRRPGARSGSRSLQRLQGCHGLADPDGCAGEQRRRLDRQCNPSGHDRYADESQGNAECGHFAVGSSLDDCKSDALARRGRGQGRKRGSDSGLWRKLVP